jgi:hypothetical protein
MAAAGLCTVKGSRASDRDGETVIPAFLAEEAFWTLLA